jgi:TonB family protein
LAEEGEFVYYEEEPIPVRKVVAVYPDSARDAHIEGVVVVHALVGKDGRVKKARVARGVMGLNEAATEAVKAWVFKPALANGSPVAVWFEVPVRFPPETSTPTPTGRAPGSDAPDSLDLIGSWRWIWSAGGLLGYRGDPGACRYERVLTLRPDRTYQFVEADSANEFVLCEGGYAIHGFGRKQATVEYLGGAPDLWISLDNWWAGHERELLVRFAGKDTLVVYPGGPYGVDDALTHSFVRCIAGTSGDTPGGRPPRLSLGGCPPGQEALQDLPAKGVFPYYDEPPVPVTQTPVIYPHFARGRHIEGVVRLHVLVGRDGRVKNIKVARGVNGLDEAAIDAVRRWVYMPALAGGKPVAVWIEVPVRFPPPDSTSTDR